MIIITIFLSTNSCKLPLSCLFVPIEEHTEKEFKIFILKNNVKWMRVVLKVTY